MAGFRVLIAGIETEGEGQPEAPVHSLETGIIQEGDASRGIGDGVFMDESNGTSYGSGVRYQMVETPFMAKVRSNNR